MRAAKNKKLGDEIRRRMVEENLTQREVAELVGTSKENVNRWVNNLSVPDPPFYRGVERFLGITEQEFAILLKKSLEDRWARRR